MLTQEIRISDDKVLEITVEEKGECTTVGQSVVVNGVRPASKTCTVTCTDTGKSYTWTCPDNKRCDGDCSNSNSPKGTCGNY